MSAIRSAFAFGIVAVAFCLVQPFPLLDAGPVFVALVVTGLLVSRMLLRAQKDDPVTPGYVVTALYPWALAVVLFTNSALDHSAETRHHTVVVGLTALDAFNIMQVQSWRPGRTTESLYLKTSLFTYDPVVWLRRGDVTVGVKPGALGLPWISSISR